MTRRPHDGGRDERRDDHDGRGHDRGEDRMPRFVRARDPGDTSDANDTNGTNDRGDLRDRSDEGAARPFPSEAEWLSLSLPADAAASGLPSGDFVARVTAALAAERALDRELAALDQELPSDLLHAFAAPEPAADFVARTVAKAQGERRTRWQQLLARHVAPDPSPHFVQRTLAALAGERSTAAAASPAAGAWRRRLAWPLLTLAAGYLIFVGWPRSERPLELRAARAAAPALAHAWSDAPAAVVLATWRDESDPEALGMGGPDGVWLAFAEVR